MSTQRPDPTNERDAYRIALTQIAFGKRNPGGAVKNYPGTVAQQMARQVLVANGVVEWGKEQ